MEFMIIYSYYYDVVIGAMAMVCTIERK